MDKKKMVVNVKAGQLFQGDLWGCHWARLVDNDLYPEISDFIYDPEAGIDGMIRSCNIKVTGRKAHYLMHWGNKEIYKVRIQIEIVNEDEESVFFGGWLQVSYDEFDYL